MSKASLGEVEGSVPHFIIRSSEFAVRYSFGIFNNRFILLLAVSIYFYEY